MMALLVDDDAANRDLLGRMLTRLGWLSDAVASGYEAVEACSRARYDVVLMDIFMPGMNGYSCAQAILDLYASKQAAPEETHYKPKIIAVTGSDDLSRGNAQLFDGFLQKPFMMDELHACLAATDPDFGRIP
ncbi:MAG: response regulator [Spirochaetales bacterium]|nr:MAG: response regulator [Spirochaetales bacterium]